MPASVSITLEGEEQIQAIVREISGDEWLKLPTEEAGATLQEELATYPPPPANSSYVRTGTLGRRWASDTAVKPFRAVAIVSNITSYAPFVQGDGTQARIHQGRWRTDVQIVDENTDKIVGFYLDAINKVLDDNTTG